MEFANLLANRPVDAQAIVDHIQGLDDLEQRRTCYSEARKALGRNEHSELDTLIFVVRAGIAEGLRQSAAEQDSETSVKRKDWANMMSYNLSADLAECWPGDTVPREPAHFEVGLACAEDCLRWRFELGKGPWPFSIAWWAKGAHCLSLGRINDAIDAFRRSLDFATKAHASGGSNDFGMILARGYLGLAHIAAGDKEGEQLFSEACDEFAVQIAAGENNAEDARFGLDQLKTMRERALSRPGCA